jgi:hypothetical protein
MTKREETMAQSVSLQSSSFAAGSIHSLKDR